MPGGAFGPETVRERCEERATDVDHIRDNGDHSMSNLRALCGYHHRRRTGAQGGKARGQNQGDYWSEK